VTDFQVALLAMGGCAVAAVLAYNKFQERRARRLGELQFPRNSADPLLRADKAQKEPASPADIPSTESRGERRTGGDLVVPDRLVDYVIDVRFESPIPETSCQILWRAIQRRFRERTALAGSADGMEWTAVDTTSPAAWLQYRAGLQLVSRVGVAGEADILEFRTMIDGLAAQLGGAISPGDARHAVSYARELDEFCAESDIQIALHLVAPDGAPFRKEEISRVATELGLQVVGGIYRRTNAAGDDVFALALDGEALHPRGTFTLDVPAVREPEDAYKQMIATAREFQGKLGGVLVDDNGGGLSDDGLAATWRAVATVIRGLSDKGFRPGMPITRRLFS